MQSMETNNEQVFMCYEKKSGGVKAFLLNEQFYI